MTRSLLAASLDVKLTGRSMQVPSVHNQTNWVGSFCRSESKVKILFAAGLVLWQSKVDTYGDT